MIHALPLRRNPAGRCSKWEALRESLSSTPGPVADFVLSRECGSGQDATILLILTQGSLALANCSGGIKMKTRSGGHNDNEIVFTRCAE
jgi:hypothetical protein